MTAPAGSADRGAAGRGLRTVGPRSPRAVTSRLPDHVLRDLAALGALLVILGLLWARARHTWYWLDEGIALGISSHPLKDIPELLRQDASPPLYYLVLHLWMALFGASEGQTHLLSLLFALATVPAALWAGWSLFGRRTGWVFALLAAVNPFIAAFANETRMYTLVVLLALLATATFLHAFVHRRRAHVPAFALCLLLLMYTHNWGLLFGLGTAAASAVCLALSTERRPLLVDMVSAFGAAALLYAPWVPTLLFQRAHTGFLSSLGPTLALVRHDLSGLFGGPEAVAVLGGVAGWGLSGVVRRPWDRRAAAVLATGAVPVVIIVTGWYASGLGAAWLFRYLAVIVPPMLLLAAVGLGHGGRAALAALAVVIFLTAPIGEKGPLHQKSNLRGIAEKVSSRLHAGDLVISPAGEVPLLARYLPKGLHFATPTGSVRDVHVADWRDITARLRRSEPGRTTPRAIDTVPSGGRLLIVCPPPAETSLDQTEFVRLNILRCNEVLGVARADNRLRLEMVLTPPPDVQNLPVEGHLFTRQAQPG